MTLVRSYGDPLAAKGIVSESPHKKQHYENDKDNSADAKATGRTVRVIAAPAAEEQ
jgi:hypothetical protein